MPPARILPECANCPGKEKWRKFQTSAMLEGKMAPSVHPFELLSDPNIRITATTQLFFFLYFETHYLLMLHCGITSGITETSAYFIGY